MTSCPLQPSTDGSDDHDNDPWPGIVTALSSDYAGTCERIIEIIGYPVMLSVEEAGLAMLQTSLLSDAARVAQIEALCARVVSRGARSSPVSPASTTVPGGESA